MIRAQTNFLRDERGAATVDWVAVTSAILLLGLFVVLGVRNHGLQPLVDDINNELTTFTLETWH